MRVWLRRLVGLVIGLIGLYWMLQGIDVVTGGFMTGNGFWALVGLVLTLLGLWLVAPPHRAGDTTSRQTANRSK